MRARGGGPYTTDRSVRTVVDPKTGRTTFTNVPLRATTSVTPKTTTAAPTRSPTRGPTPVAHASSSQGRIARSAAAKHAFEVQTGYSQGRPGYVVDHVKPLACGSADTPSNMQWQTKVVKHLARWLLTKARSERRVVAVLPAAAGQHRTRRTPLGRQDSPRFRCRP